MLHLKGVLSEETVAHALAAIEEPQRGEGGATDLIGWENGQPFREMMGHPAVLARLAWMQGPGSCNNSRSLFSWYVVYASYYQTPSTQAHYPRYDMECHIINIIPRYPPPKTKLAQDSACHQLTGAEHSERI
eukprot:COSAG06_NODE_5560_length_3402_cov_2.273388_1_plen_132_part_00